MNQDDYGFTPTMNCVLGNFRREGWIVVPSDSGDGWIMSLVYLDAEREKKARRVLERVGFAVREIPPSSGFLVSD